MPTICQPCFFVRKRGFCTFASDTANLKPQIVKKILFLFVLLLAVSAQAKDKVVYRPAFQSGPFSIFPVKVELKKDATVVHFKLRRPGQIDWRLTGAHLESDGQVYAYKSGRLLTHDGKTLLNDEELEFGKNYEKNAQRDSLILSFEPLPKGAKVFDFLEDDNESSWVVRGIRLDDQLYPFILPPYQQPLDNGQPLQPLTLKDGEATATLTFHGNDQFAYFGDPSRNPITGEYESKSYNEGDSTLVYCHPANVATRPVFLRVTNDVGSFSQFPLILIPGETFTLEVDGAACTAHDNEFVAGKPTLRDCYRVGGTLGDLNQVLLENSFLYSRYIGGTPTYKEGEDVAAWCDALWQSLDTLCQGVVERQGYTRRQQDFLQLLMENYYVRTVQEHTLIDTHAKDLQLFRDGRTYYLPLQTNHLPYLEANGLDHGEVYQMLKSFAEAKEIGERMKQGKVQPDSVILAAHPYFQPVLRAFNDSTRVLVERLEREAKDRMMPTPDVPADQLLQSIVAQHSGKVVFIDFWATWCGPCMSGIKAMEPLKEQLQGSDVVFVYLTNESSPLNKWNEHVLSIPGLHYRLPSSLMQQIPCIAAESGIPQYLIFDRQGHQVWHQVGFSNSVLENIKQEIGKALDSSSLSK